MRRLAQRILDHAKTRPARFLVEVDARALAFHAYPKSSNISAVAYSAARRQLDIMFLTRARGDRGPVYRYYGVSKRVYNALVHVKSHGKSFWRNVRRRPYRFRRLSN